MGAQVDAQATEGQAPLAASVQVIEVNLVAPIGNEPTLAERIASWFDPEHFRVRVECAPALDAKQILEPQGDAIVHVWVALDGDRLARLFFATSSQTHATTTYLVRDLPLDQGLDEIGKERIAEVLHFSTLALLEGGEHSDRSDVQRALVSGPRSSGRVGQPTHPVEKSRAAHPPRATREPEPLSGRRAWVGIGYGLSARGDEGLWHGPRAAFGVELGSLFGVSLDAQSVLPVTNELAPIALRIYGATVELDASIRARIAHDWSVAFFGGPALDIVHYASSSSAPHVVAGQFATETRPRAGVGTAIVFVGSPNIAGVIGALIALDRTHYDLIRDGGGGPAVVGRAARVAPSVAFEARF